MEIIKYSDEELINILKIEYKKSNQITVKNFKIKNDLPAYENYISRFGSWANAKELAGLSRKKSGKIKLTKEEIVYNFKEAVKKNGFIPRVDKLNIKEGFPSRYSIDNYFETYNDFVIYCGFEYNLTHNGKYKDDFLISEIQRFVSEFKKVPVQTDFENLEGYPSRKTFGNHFHNFNEVLILSGYIPLTLTMEEKIDYVAKRATAENISILIYKYIDKYNKIPTQEELIKEIGYSPKEDIKKIFDTWNKCLIKLGLPLNQISHHEDSFLESEFHRFVKQKGRIPTLLEFNGSEYPSFWCYQNRFGSWNKAVISYGYTPTDANRKYYLDNGEICGSSYEFDISTWLQSNGRIYERDINYIDFIDGYKGKMNCDYKIYYNDKIWYVEMAGFLNSKIDFNKFSSVEKNYFFKLMYKKKILKRQKVNYLIIEPNDLKKKTLEEIFSVIFNE